MKDEDIVKDFVELILMLVFGGLVVFGTSTDMLAGVARNMIEDSSEDMLADVARNMIEGSSEEENIEEENIEENKKQKLGNLVEDIKKNWKDDEKNQAEQEELEEKKSRKRSLDKVIYFEEAGLKFELQEKTGQVKIVRPLDFDLDQCQVNNNIEIINMSYVKYKNKMYPVTGVGAGAFYRCEGLKEVILPKVTTVGNEVFVGCCNLKEVRLPNLKEAGSNLFLGCNNLETVELSDIKLLEVIFKNDLEKIKTNKQETEEKKEKITVDFSGEEKEVYCYERIWYELNHKDKTAKIIKANKMISIYNPQIDKINIYNNIYTITEIGNQAFRKCKRLTGKLTIGNNVEIIGDEAFYKCKNLTSLKIGNNVEIIGVGAFSCCCDLFGDLILSDNINNMGDFAFAYCEKLTSVKIGNELKEIPARAFFSCSKLERLTIGNKVEKIKKHAFEYCERLKGTLEIPDSVKEIEKYAFCNCESLTGLHLGNNIEKIGDMAFCACKKISRLVLSNNLKEIGNLTFAGCKGLKDTLVLPEALETIENKAFENCDIDIVIPEEKRMYLKENPEVEYTGRLRNGPVTDIILKI